VNSPFASLRPWKFPEGEAALTMAPAMGFPPSLEVTVPTIEPVDAASALDRTSAKKNTRAGRSASRNVGIRARLGVVERAPSRSAGVLSII
jgi:hypothetical protein